LNTLFLYIDSQEVSQLKRGVLVQRRVEERVLHWWLMLRLRIWLYYLNLLLNMICIHVRGLEHVQKILVEPDCLIIVNLDRFVEETLVNEVEISIEHTHLNSNPFPDSC